MPATPVPGARPRAQTAPNDFGSSKEEFDAAFLEKAHAILNQMYETEQSELDVLHEDCQDFTEHVIAMDRNEVKLGLASLIFAGPLSSVHSRARLKKGVKQMGRVKKLYSKRSFPAGRMANSAARAVLAHLHFRRFASSPAV